MVTKRWTGSSVTRSATTTSSWTLTLSPRPRGAWTISLLREGREVTIEKAPRPTIW